MVGVTAFPALASPALAPLWHAAHDRLSSGRRVSRVRVGPLTDEQRAALADLLGLDRLPGEYTTVSLSTVDDLLRESVGAGVTAVVTDLLGPLDDRAGHRARAAEERDALWAWLADHEVVTGQPALAEWVAALRRVGLIGGSVPRTRAELERALRVLARLPAEGAPLPVLAQDALDDPHGLDDGTRCAGLVLRALAIIYGAEAATDASARRALWARAGVAEDELSSVVLAAGLAPSGPDLASRLLRLCSEAGQAAALTLRQVRSATSFTAAPNDVWVVENPSVLAVALARFGAECPPLVCTSGWPNGAGILLLRRLAAAVSALHYHGDFDGEGIRIAAHVLARTGATAWRMSTADYLAALSESKSGPAIGRISEAPWDRDLAGAMRTHGVAVPEERVVDLLLAELAR
jgi:uncharacterized protein (TIGR02679 family)